MNLLLKLLIAMICLSVLGDQLPLEEDRVVHIDTDEFTWLSIDVSPDGETIVLEVVGDLYTVPIAGGDAQPLTSGMAFDSQPVYSPDGSKIAFISDSGGKEDVWIINDDGSNPRALSDANADSLFASPSWSPKGDHVVASKSSWSLGTYEVWAYHLRGGKGVGMTSSGGSGTTRNSRHNALGAVYSPDGLYLYYSRKFGGFGYDLRLPIWQVVRRELKTGFEDRLTGTSGGAFKPLISHNGNLMAYATRSQGQTGLRIRDLESGTDEWFAYPVQRDDQESRYTRDVFPNYAFTPDDEDILYTYQGKLWRKRVQDALEGNSSPAQEIPIRVTIEKGIGPQLYFPYRLGLGPVKSRMIRHIELSPDGKEFVFSALGRIYVYNRDTQTSRRLSEDVGFAAYPTWSPDGNTVAYVTWSDYGGDLWIVAGDGSSSPSKISRNSASYSQPLWSYDGNHIYAFRGINYERQAAGSDWGQAPGTDIVSIPLNSQTDTERTVRPARGLSNLHWGPDNNRLYAYLFPGLFRSGNSGLVSMRLDGSDFRNHVIVKGKGIYYDANEVPATNMELSPNGQYMLVQHTNQLTLLVSLQSDFSTIEASIGDPLIPSVHLTETGVDHFGWSSDSSLVYWSVGNQISYRSIEDIERLFDCSLDEFSDNPDCEDYSDHSDQDTPPELHPSVVTLSVDIYEAREEPVGTLALVGGTVIPMDLNEPTKLTNATVVIEGDRIKHIGIDLEIPDDATVVDVTGAYVLPGYVDTHAHFEMYRDRLDPQMWSLSANLAYGITTATDVQPSTVDVIEYGDIVDAGLMLAPRVLSTGPGVFSDNDFKSVNHAKRVLERYAEHYQVKNIKAYLIGNRKQRHWLLQAARELEIMPTAEGGLDTKLVITHAIDGFSGNEHNIPVLGLYDDVVQVLAQSQIAYTPTLMVGYGGPRGEGYFITRESPLLDPKLNKHIPRRVLDSKLRRGFWAHEEDHIFETHAAQALRIVRAGGKVGVGSHGQLQGLGFHWELWSFAMGGFSNFEVLRAATRHGAEMIGVGKDVGSIEIGKLADLVVLKNDPLEDIRATDDLLYVVRGGVVRETDSLKPVWPEQEQLQSD